MPTCIICHMEISEGVDILRQCPNGHTVHDECLQEWLKHSPNCPLCNSPYTQDLVDKSKDLLKQEEIEKDKTERLKKIEVIAEKMVFLKFIDSIEELLEKELYNLAIEKLDAYENKTLPIDKKRNITFLKGKTFYLMGRYDMAIGNLFKLVKEKYDYPDAFLYLGKSYQELGLDDKAKWAFDRVSPK